MAYTYKSFIIVVLFIEMSPPVFISYLKVHNKIFNVQFGGNTTKSNNKLKHCETTNIKVRKCTVDTLCTLNQLYMYL